MRGAAASCVARERDRFALAVRWGGMISSRVPALIGCAIFGGFAFAWVLPPTTPIGGPTLAEISHVAPAAYPATPSFDRLPPETPMQPPQPAVYDPGMPAIVLDARPARPEFPGEPVAEEAAEVSSDYGPRAYSDDYERAFRVGYRQAKRQGYVDPDACEQYDDPARADGCRKYLDDSDQPALTYDTPTS
jgi:hypothetical protein